MQKVKAEGKRKIDKTGFDRNLSITQTKFEDLMSKYNTLQSPALYGFIYVVPSEKKGKLRFELMWIGT